MKIKLLFLISILSTTPIFAGVYSKGYDVDAKQYILSSISHKGVLVTLKPGSQTYGVNCGDIFSRNFQKLSNLELNAGDDRYFPGVIEDRGCGTIRFQDIGNPNNYCIISGLGVMPQHPEWGYGYNTQTENGAMHCTVTTSNSLLKFTLSNSSALPPQFKAANISITTETTASGADYKMYANGKHEAPLYIKVQSADQTDIPAKILQPHLVIYNKNTGKILNHGDDGIAVSYTNNGFDASLPNNDISYHTPNLYDSDSGTDITAYLTTTTPFQHLPVCAKVTNNDGTVIDTCGDVADAPAYVSSSISPGFTLSVGSTSCLYDDPRTQPVLSAYADYTKITSSQPLGNVTGIKNNYYDYFHYQLVAREFYNGHTSLWSYSNMNYNNYSILYREEKTSNGFLRDVRLNTGGSGYTVLQYLNHGTSLSNRLGIFSIFYVAPQDIIKSVTRWPNGVLSGYPSPTTIANLSGPAIYIVTNNARSESLEDDNSYIAFAPLLLTATDIYGDTTSTHVGNYNSKTDFIMSCPDKV